MCDKFIKKALVGCTIFSYFIFGRFIDSSIINANLDILISIVVFILGMYFILPYINCLTNYNKRGKPPF